MDLPKKKTKYDKKPETKGTKPNIGNTENLSPLEKHFENEQKIVVSENEVIYTIYILRQRHSHAYSVRVTEFYNRMKTL